MTITLSKREIIDMVEPYYKLDLLYKSFEPKTWQIETTDFSVINKKRIRSRNRNILVTKRQSSKDSNNIASEITNHHTKNSYSKNIIEANRCEIIKEDFNIDNINNNIDNINIDVPFKLKKVNQKTRKIRSKSKKKRKFNKDCMLKKIKSRFIKLFINDHMKTFADYLNRQTVCKFQEKIAFFRLNDYFVKDITKIRNNEWGLITKSAFQLFTDYSNMPLKQVYNLYINNNSEFNKMIANLNETTKFRLFRPMSEVFDTIMQDQNSFTYFFNTVKKDLDKKNEDGDLKENYYLLFKDNVSNFTSYYSS